MKRTRRKRCPFCRDLFWPRNQEQRVCSKEECQKKRRVETQASWRARNPEYQKTRRLYRRSVQAEAAQFALENGSATVVVAHPLRLPPELHSLPWARAADRFGVELTDFVAMVARVLILKRVEVQRLQAVARGSPCEDLQKT
jgi:hypothetical protein